MRSAAAAVESPSRSARSKISRSESPIASRRFGERGVVPPERLLAGKVDHAAGVHRRSRGRIGCPPPLSGRRPRRRRAGCSPRPPRPGSGRCGIVSRLSTLPVAQGEKTSHTVPITSSAPRRCRPESPLPATVGPSASTSASRSVAPASRRCRRGGSRPSRGLARAPSGPQRVLGRRHGWTVARSRGRRRAPSRRPDRPSRRSPSSGPGRATCAPDHVHVRLAGVHVGRRHVGPVERLDQLRVPEEERSAVAAAVGRNLGTAITALPPPYGRSASRLLPRHRVGEAEDVIERLGGARVGLQPGSAHRGPDDRAVDADEHPGGRRLVAMDDDLLAVPGLDQILERHGVESRRPSRPTRTRSVAPRSSPLRGEGVRLRRSQRRAHGPRTALV